MGLRGWVGCQMQAEMRSFWTSFGNLVYDAMRLSRRRDDVSRYRDQHVRGPQCEGLGVASAARKESRGAPESLTRARVPCTENW